MQIVNNISSDKGKNDPKESFTSFSEVLIYLIKIFKMQVGSNIKKIREGLNFSIESIANDLNMDVNHYEGIESDKVDMTLSEFEAIANRLSSTVVEIIELNEPTKGIRNYFNNNNGNLGTIVNVQGINQEEIRKTYKELYSSELDRIPKLEKLLRANDITFNF